MSKKLDFKLAILAVTNKGARIGAMIALATGAELHLLDGLNQGLNLPAEIIVKTCYFDKLSLHIKDNFHKYNGLVFIMSLGIVNRVIAPMLTDKYNDPAVVSVDEAGRYAISALSGHEGGANQLAFTVSSIIGSVPIITTMTEAVKSYVCGIGCKRGVKAQAIESAINEACKLAGINISDLRLITSAWIKRNETGLIEGAANLGLNIRFIPKKQIDFFYLNGHSNKDIERSEFVFKHTGVYGVCEPCALIASDMGELILKKTSFSGTSFSGITIAIAKENPPIIF